MQAKSLLLLLVIGAVVVLAKKESSEEKDDYENFKIWPYPQHGQKHSHKFFKHGRPWVQNPTFLVNRPHAPQQPSQEITSAEVKNFLENIEREMQKVSFVAYNEFQTVESQIERNVKDLENSLFNQLQNVESLMASKEAREIKQAVKQGKDEQNIKNCLKDEEADFKLEMKRDVDRTMKCVNDATQKAKKEISDARNKFTENSVFVNVLYKNWAFQLSSCVYKNDVFCFQQMVFTITENAKAIVEEGKRQVQKLQDTPRQQMIQLDYCQENFLQDMKEMRSEYTNLIKECVSKTSNEESEKKDEENEDEED